MISGVDMMDYCRIARITGRNVAKEARSTCRSYPIQSDNVLTWFRIERRKMEILMIPQTLKDAN